MTKLSSGARNELPKKEFALPKERKFPIPDAAHAANAKARATQQFDKGNLSKHSMLMVDAKANKAIHRGGKRGG